MLSTITEEYGISPQLAIAYLIVTALVVVMAIVCAVLELRVYLKYRKANKIEVEKEMTGMDAARYILDKSGHSNVTVRKAGFLRELIFGNYYNIATKTIYLRSVFGKIDKKQTVTSMALGVQKAAIACLCEEGDQQTITRNKLSLVGIFGPFLFIPFVLGGALIDIFLLKGTMMASLIGLGVGGLFLVIGLIVTFLNIPVEKKANEKAIALMREHQLANESELEIMKDVYDAYILSYIAQFILQVLRIVQWILEIVIKMQSSSSK